MFVIWSILYLLIGGTITFFAMTESHKTDLFFDRESEIVFAVLVGIFWPAAAPFAVAVLMAERIKNR